MVGLDLFSSLSFSLSLPFSLLLPFAPSPIMKSYYAEEHHRVKILHYFTFFKVEEYYPKLTECEIDTLLYLPTFLPLRPLCNQPPSFSLCISLKGGLIIY